MIPESTASSFLFSRARWGRPRVINRVSLRCADWRRTWLGALLICFVLPAVSATPPPPKLNSLSSQWLQRGQTTDVTFEGENLGDIRRFVFAGDAKISVALGSAGAKPEVLLESATPGLFSGDKVSDSKKLYAKVTVPEEAAVGRYEVRVVNAGGVSNPLQLDVSDLPEINERPGTNSFETATALELPTGVAGRINEMGQVDWFRFHAKKGERLIFDVNASRVGSPLDPSLGLFDAKGRELLRSEDVNVFDPFVDWTVPEEGDYLIQIRDFRFQGGATFKYHLVAGAVPYLDYVFPFGGQRGQPVTLNLSGRNLAEQTNMQLRIAGNAPLGLQEVRARTPRGISNERSFEVSEYPEFAEGTKTAGTNEFPLKPPLNINGHLAAATEIDTFDIKGENGQRFIFEVMASRFGSPLDALLTLTVSDTNNTVLQRNDDAVGADARIDYTFTNSGIFRLSVRDLLERGGENFGYRIAIRPPAKPDFSAKASVDAVRIHRGGCVVLPIEVARNGYSGPLEITPDKLPPGVTCREVLVPADGSVGTVRLLASADAPLDSSLMRLKVQGVIDGKRVERHVQASAGDRPAREAWVTVLDKPPFSVEWISLDGQMEQNQSSKLLAKLTRHDGFAGDVKVSVEGFSAGKDPISRSAEVQSVTLKTNATDAEFKIKAKNDSEIGTRPIYLKAEATVDGQPAVEYSESIPLTITEFPFTLVNSLPRLALTALPKGTQSAAGEAEFSVKATRRGLFNEDIALAFEGLPEGIVATTTNLPRGVTEAAFKLTTNEKAKAGTTNKFTVVGTAGVNGRSFTQRTPEISLIVNAPADTGEQAAAAK